MGHSASIAKKYQPRPSGYHGNHGQEDDDHDSLATVSSYRPTSPLAHSDAQKFSFDNENRPPSRNGHVVNGMVSNGSLGKSPHASGVHQLRSMRDVNHYLIKNPELLSRRKSKSSLLKHDFDGVGDQKQIKTKQNVYMGFFDPPTVYGKGVDPDKQLKINQRVYLQLIHPTYGQQFYKPYRPLIPSDMIVVRKDDFTRKPPLERTRPPLKGMDVTRASPESLRMSQQRPPSRQFSHSTKSPHIPDRHLSSSTPARDMQQRRHNQYIDIPPSSLRMRNQGSRLSKLNPDLMEVERRFETPTNSLGRSSLKQASRDENIVFDYTVEDLGLKKKSRGSQKEAKDTSRSVEPLYFRKSLAYNPRYSNGGNILSDPL